MATSLTLQNDPTLQQGYLRVNGITAATITTSGLSMSTLNSINVDDYTVLSDFIGANRSLTTNGYQRLPGGLIIQWGTTGTNTSNPISYLTLSWPIAFPNACLNATTTCVTDYTNFVSTDIMGVAEVNATQGKFTGSTNADTSRRMDLWWIAIGY